MAFDNIIISQNSNLPKKLDTAFEVSLPFTAQHDCFLQLIGINQSGTNGYYMYLQINGVLQFPLSGMTPNNWQISHCFHMRKGEKLTLQDGAGLANWHIYCNYFAP